MNLEEIVDRNAALRRLGGDENLFRDLVGFFIEDAPVLQQQIRAALVQVDVDRLTQSAHAIKGLCAGLNARRALDAAERLESCGRSNDLKCADLVFAELNAELSRLYPALQQYADEF